MSIPGSQLLSSNLSVLVQKGPWKSLGTCQQIIRSRNAFFVGSGTQELMES